MTTRIRYDYCGSCLIFHFLLMGCHFLIVGSVDGASVDRMAIISLYYLDFPSTCGDSMRLEDQNHFIGLFYSNMRGGGGGLKPESKCVGTVHANIKMYRGNAHTLFW